MSIPESSHHENLEIQDKIDLSLPDSPPKERTTSDEEKKKKKKKKFTPSETDRHIIISSIRNPIQSLEVIQESLGTSLVKSLTVKHLRKRITQLHKEKYLHYDGSSIKVTSKGRKFVFSLLDSWMEGATREEEVVFKDTPSTHTTGVNLARLDLAFTKNYPVSMPDYCGYYGPFHQYVVTSEPVSQVILEDTTIIQPEGVLGFKEGKNVHLGFVFFITSPQVNFLSHLVDRELKEMIWRFATIPTTSETKQKLERVFGGEIQGQNLFLITLEKGRRDSLVESLSVPSGSKIFLAWLEELTTAPGIWGEVWYVPGEKSPEELQKLWQRGGE